jgi:hypothetical protein
MISRQNTLAGGTASGKSEYVSEYLTDTEAIILDGTLPTFTGAEIKIKRALKAEKRVAIHCVLPESFPVAFVAFLNRDRKFSDEHFYRTHSATRVTLLAIAEKYPDIPITIIMSKVTYTSNSSSMSFRELGFDNRPTLIEFLQREQYTEGSIKKLITQSS